MAEYKADRAQFAKFMKSPIVADIVKSRAEAGAEFLKGIAPKHEGHYVENIRVSEGVSNNGDRVIARIEVNDESAAPMEWGNEHIKNPPKPLAKTIEFIEGGT